MDYKQFAIQSIQDLGDTLAVNTDRVGLKALPKSPEESIGDKTIEIDLNEYKAWWALENLKREEKIKQAIETLEKEGYHVSKQ